MSREFTGVVAAVTGGGSGIGAAVARHLVERGARVATLDLVLDLAPDGVLALRADVRDEASLTAAFSAVVDEWSRFDVLVNSAGIGAQGTIATNRDDEWLAVLDVNLLGVVRSSRAALPHLRRSDRAAIVNIGSIAATVGIPQRAAYSASKGAVHALTRAMAADHLHEGIRVNCVAPGTADTPWVQRLLANATDVEAERAALEARQPHGRLVTADEVAGAVAYLASPSSGSTTGVCLAVDGGMNDLRLGAPDHPS